MSEKDVERWNEEAMKLEQVEISTPGMPIDDLLLEADGTAHLMKTYWEPAKDGSRPGLSVMAKHLDFGKAEEIFSLVRASRTVHTRIIWPGEIRDDYKSMMDRAHFLLEELVAVCEFVTEDGVSESVDLALSKAKSRATADNTTASFIQSLVDYVGIAESIKGRLVEVGAFDVRMIDETKQLVSKLGRFGPARVGRPSSPDTDLRNRLLTLLGHRVKLVRLVARYVFHRHPDIARKFSSAYQRRKRSMSRKKKAEIGSSDPTSAQVKSARAKSGRVKSA